MKNELQRILLAIEGGRVKRCHCFPTNSDPTIGLHIFNALSLLLILCPDPSINMIKALQFHDMGERFLGDLPAPAKFNCPVLKEIYEGEEKSILMKYGMLPILDDRERNWIHAVDMLEFFIFINYELNLGNNYARQRLARITRMLDKAELPKPIKDFYNKIRLGQILELDEDRDM